MPCSERPAHALGEHDAASRQPFAKDPDAVQLGIRRGLANDRGTRRAVAEEILVRPLDNTSASRRVGIGNDDRTTGERSDSRDRQHRSRCR